MPVIVLAISLIMFIYFLVQLNSKKAKLSVIHLLLATFIISMMFIIGISQLNIKMIDDDASNTEEISGNIDKISEVLLAPKFYYLGNRVDPKIIRIDGVNYYIMTIGDFTIGDDVTIEYLPNSRLVISIYSNSDN
jgi:hypothetical protein